MLCKENNTICLHQQIRLQARPWDHNLPCVRVRVLFMAPLTWVTLLARWSLQHPALTRAAFCPIVWVRWEGAQLHSSMASSFLLPITWDSKGGRSSVQLSPIPSPLLQWVSSSPPCSPVSPLAGPRCELLSYYIWNPRPNCAAKNTPSNQIIVMWVNFSLHSTGSQ